jgi:osmoprotectant transport system permease protein
VNEPFIRWDWIADHLDQIGVQLVEHIQLTAVAVAIGLLISFPLGVLAYRARRFYTPVTTFTGILYTIPSLALFAFLVPYTGLTFLTAEIGLVSYTLLILIRNIVAGLRGVPSDVKEAAVGMGYSSRQVLWRIELPLALPVIVAGIRVATVTTIGLVTVTALIGLGGLGHFILVGIRQFFTTPMLIGAVLSFVLAVVADGLLLAGQKLLTPWARGRTVRAI